MSHRDLITYDRLAAANAGAVSDLSSIQQEAHRTIGGVSGLIRSRLSRVMIVEKVKQRLAPHHWSEDEAISKAKTKAYADEQPLVEITDEGTVTTSDVSIRDPKRFRGSSAQVGEVVYFAGWRRPDQVLSNAQGNETPLPTGSGEELDGLSTLPPTLPTEVAEVAIDVTLHVLKRRDENLGQRSERAIGGQQTIIEQADRSFIQRQMARLSQYDRSKVIQ